MRIVDASYEDGLLKPVEPLTLRPGERVGLIVVRRPDPDRWNLECFAMTESEEEVVLAEHGLRTWAEALDEEDRR